MKTKIPLCRTIFSFSSKILYFAGMGALFGTFFNLRGVSSYFAQSPRGPVSLTVRTVIIRQKRDQIVGSNRSVSEVVAVSNR